MDSGTVDWSAHYLYRGVIYKITECFYTNNCAPGNISHVNLELYNDRTIVRIGVECKHITKLEGDKATLELLYG